MAKKTALFPVAIESSSGNQFGPIFPDKKFRYIPIPEFPKNYVLDILAAAGNPLDVTCYDHSYREIPEILPTNAQNPPTKCLGDYLAEDMYPLYENKKIIYRAPLPDWAPHVDPEFTTFTYGEGSHNKAKTISTLHPGDLLLFYASLSPQNLQGPAKKYIIGYFTIKQIRNFRSRLKGDDLDYRNIPADILNNFHILRYDEDPVLAVGDENASQLLETAIPMTDAQYIVYPELVKFIPWHFPTQKIHMGTRIFPRPGQTERWLAVLRGEGPSQLYDRPIN